MSFAFDIQNSPASGVTVWTVYLLIRENVRLRGEYVHARVDRREYDAFLEEQKAAWNLKKGKYQTRFIPDSIAFANETKRVVPG